VHCLRWPHDIVKCTGEALASLRIDISTVVEVYAFTPYGHPKIHQESIYSPNCITNAATIIAYLIKHRNLNTDAAVWQKLRRLRQRRPDLCNLVPLQPKKSAT
jgi:hypothetical protein